MSWVMIVSLEKKPYNNKETCLRYTSTLAVHWYCSNSQPRLILSLLDLLCAFFYPARSYQDLILFIETSNWSFFYTPHYSCHWLNNANTIYSYEYYYEGLPILGKMFFKILHAMRFGMHYLTRHIFHTHHSLTIDLFPIN